jgi:hypothetical protein
MSEAGASKEYRYQLKPDARLRDIKGLLTLHCVDRVEGVAEGKEFKGAGREWQAFGQSDALPFVIVYARAPIAFEFVERYVESEALAS